MKRHGGGTKARSLMLWALYWVIVCEWVMSDEWWVRISHTDAQWIFKIWGMDLTLDLTVDLTLGRWISQWMFKIWGMGGILCMHTYKYVLSLADPPFPIISMQPPRPMRNERDGMEKLVQFLSQRRHKAGGKRPHLVIQHVRSKRPLYHDKSRVG